MENPICQSCGMPLHPHTHGTGADGLRIEDYCIHCYRNGGFTSDVTMEEMMRLCANYVQGNTRFYIANMKTLYPHLKRWARKEDTESEYYKSVNRVIDHLKANLHEHTGLKKVAGIARISPYHFHRIFKSVIGESLGEYVNRLRMEYIAEQLKASSLPLAELAERTGYSSEQALSRAFRNYFGLPPKTFKTTFFQETFRGELVPRICKVSEKQAIELREPGLNREGWQKLYMYALVNRLLSDATESLEVIRDGAYSPALTIQKQYPPDKYVGSLILTEGRYAIFTHKGETTAIAGLYAAVRNFWLPRSKYDPAPGPPYVVYLNSGLDTPAGELLSELYIPLTAKKKD